MAAGIIDWTAMFAGASAIAAIAASWVAFVAPRSAAKLAEELRRSAVENERKLDCLRRVAGFRSMPPRQEWLAALNEIVITFNDNPEVMRALVTFERRIRERGGHDNTDLLDLIKAMMKALNLSREVIDDEFFLRPFNYNPPMSPRVFPPQAPRP